MLEKGKLTRQNPRGGKPSSSTWAKSLFLCSISLRAQHCQAFLRDHTRTRMSQHRRKHPFHVLATIEDETAEEVETLAPSRVVMKDSDYQNKFVNVTSTPFFVDQSHPLEPSPEKNNQEPKQRRRLLWRRGDTCSEQEGIRRKKLPQLSSLLERAGAMEYDTQSSPRRHYAARTISGLIHALAEEAIDLEVKVDAKADTPLWEKEINEVEIKFSKLSFKPLRIGGVNQQAGFEDDGELDGNEAVVENPLSEELSMPFLDLSSVDESFQRMDVDNSGALDRDEIIRALNMAAGCLEVDPDDPQSLVIENIANDLFDLYDFNGDGVVDRNEYQSLVEDMAALTTTQGERQSDETSSWFSTLFTATKNYATHIFRSDKTATNATSTINTDDAIQAVKDDMVETKPGALTLSSSGPSVVDVSDSAQDMGSMAKSLGSITLLGLKLDLRRLAFGGVPLLKHITPGGPLILEPFTMNVVGSFSASDIMNSPLLNAGLQQLVALVLRRRMRSFRDLLDLSVLKGRDWTMASAMAPVTKVTELSSVEFDNNNKMIITGRAKIRTRPGAPTIEQAFKVRVNAGTRQNGRFIRLVEPELAFVLECPKPIEEGIGLLFENLNLERPSRPKPLYSFFPVYSPFQVDDNDGFDLGDDNRIKRIYIEDGALKFEMKATIRPGRFLGNHYIAFSVPNRTFIVTLDRVKEGIRAARQAKAELKAATPKAVRREERVKEKIKRGPKSFFSRFVDGYRQVEAGLNPSAPVTTAIRDFFVRQSADILKTPMSNRQESTSTDDDSSPPTDGM